MEVRDQRLIRRILRVNHAGEHGAVSIYGAQISVIGTRDNAPLHWLEQTIEHERQHRQRFLDAMPVRESKPCRALFVWRFGGALLGTLTAGLGPTGIMVCTSAVERTVHRHLTEQIAFLDRADPELSSIVRAILVEEDEHLSYADAHHDSSTIFAKALAVAVAAATEALICLSTRGDSLGLRRALRSAA